MSISTNNLSKEHKRDMGKKCAKCNEIKPYSEFHNRTLSSDGKDGTCKICRKNTTTVVDKLQNSPDKNRKPAEVVLRKLGYELYNEDYPVHEQFNERIATKYNVK